MKTLLVEDEDVYRFATSKYLKDQGYICESASDYDEALEKMLAFKYDCIILDIKLPGGSGLDLLRELKKHNSQAAVIIASSNITLEDKIGGLQAGADDYITKPYSFEELDARIKSVIRRLDLNKEEIIKFNEITIFPASHAVKILDNMVNLTIKEHELLLYFISNKAKVISKRSIVEHVWDDDHPSTCDFIYAHIKNLRKKLIEAGCKDYLQTVYGEGYKFGQDII